MLEIVIPVLLRATRQRDADDMDTMGSCDDFGINICTEHFSLLESFHQEWCQWAYDGHIHVELEWMEKRFVWD